MTHPMNMETLPVNFKKPERFFYLGWIVLTSICIPITYILTVIILKIITDMVGDSVYVNGVRHITEDYLLMYIFVPIASLLTGALQYGLLSHYLARMGWWVFATVAGWFLGVFLIALPVWLGWTDGPLNNLDLIFFVMGSAIGIIQWLLLRRRLALAGWWIAASALGWGLLGLITPGNSLNQYGLFALGVLPACSTAAMLAWLMSRVQPAEPRM
jgi:hypothetical protein